MTQRPPAEPDPDLPPPSVLDVASSARHAERILAPGPITLDDSECLQALCGLTEPEADDLIAGFGSLPEVMGAAVADLARAAGRRTAIRIKLAQELGRRMLLRPLKDRMLFGANDTICDYLRTALVGAPREQFRVLFLNKRNRLIADEVLNEGTVDNAPVYPREVVRRALELNAMALILAHNHPSGDPYPSSADVTMTREIVDAARALGIRVHDHIIVAGERTVSFQALKLL